MRQTINLIVGAYAIFTVIYKVATCFSCRESFLGIDISGLVYVLIWTAAAIALFYPAYRKHQNEKKLP